MSSTRAWLFRVLVLASGGFLLYSWLAPWWSAFIRELPGKEHMVIRPWGLELDNVLDPYMDLAAGWELPSWFPQAMWAYLGIVIAVLLFSLWAKDKDIRIWKAGFKLPSLIIGVAGFSYIVVLVTAAIVATIKTGDVLDMQLIGTTAIALEGGTGEAGSSGFIVADALLGYWLAWGAGTLLIVLALLRNKIIGKSDQ